MKKKRRMKIFAPLIQKNWVEKIKFCDLNKNLEVGNLGVLSMGESVEERESEEMVQKLL